MSDRLEVAPVAIGPTWQQDRSGAWILPAEDRTLGWQVAGWAAESLKHPDGTAWKYTLEQLRFLLWWFAINDAGRFVYRYAMLRRVKGWGKDPFAATLCAAEFVGPCRFDGFDAHGKPVAAPFPSSWVLIAAVSKDQTRNTMTLFPALFSDDCIAEHSIDIGKEILYAHQGRCRMEAVTSSPRALEGPRVTFTLKNETQHWLVNNDGHAMSAVIARNAAKSKDGASRILAISNAHQPGEDSDAEHDFEAWQAIDQRRSRTTGFLYDSLEAPPDVEIADEAQVRAGLRAARGDSVWLDEDRLVEEIYDTRNSVATSRRFYLNQIVAAEDAWITPQQWDPLHEPDTVAAGEQIALGFDGSKTDDHSALIGCRISDGYVFAIDVWDPASHGGEAPRDLIDLAVRSAFEKWRVIAFFSDLHPFESYVDKWADEFGKGLVIKASPKHPIAWDMRGRQKEATIEIERLHDEIVERVFRHDGHPAVRQHFHNARRAPNAWGITVRKEHRESPRKIDSVPATMLARTARRLAFEKRPQNYRSAGFH